MNELYNQFLEELNEMENSKQEIFNILAVEATILYQLLDGTVNNRDLKIPEFLSVLEQIPTMNHSLTVLMNNIIRKHGHIVDTNYTNMHTLIDDIKKHATTCYSTEFTLSVIERTYPIEYPYLVSLLDIDAMLYNQLPELVRIVEQNRKLKIEPVELPEFYK